MENLIECVLLVDDNRDDNFFHKRALKKNGKIGTIRVAENGLEALDYLNNEGAFTDKEENPRPNIIFLDINMPRMNGFEFLEHYKTLDEEKKAEVCVIMLSTSKNPEDMAKAKGIHSISDFYTKPLDNEFIEKAIEKYYQTCKPQ